MAGQIVVSTISDGTNSTSSTNCIQGSAKAWVNFNGTTSPGTIRASFNVGSVTKNGAGDYTVNFTSALADANYSLVANGQDASGYVIRFHVNTPFTSASARIQTVNPNVAVADCPQVCVAVFR